MHAIGIDLALRSTAVVRIEYEAVGGAQRIVGITRYYAQQRRRPKKGTKAAKWTPTTIAQLGQEILRDVPLEELPVGIDLDLSTVYWGGARRDAAAKAFLGGYLYRSILEKGGFPVCIPPVEVRRFLKLSHDATKEETQLALLDLFHPQIDPSSWSGDQMDGVLLAFVAAMSLGDHPWIEPSPPPVFSTSSSHFH